MIIRETIGNIETLSPISTSIDWLPLEWYETEKRIQRKITRSGKEISLRFLAENPGLRHGDILFSDESIVIAVEVLPAECIIIRPRNMHEMAAVCYEIGNKHLPLFYDNEMLLVPYEATLFRQLTALEYDVMKEQRKMQGALKTTTSPHRHGSSSSLFETIMQLTQPKHEHHFVSPAPIE